MERTPTLTPTPPAAPGWRRKSRDRYRHGDLRPSALARGRQIVTLHGPAALTLRGLARDLGVTATSLVRLFGNLVGMRAAVAESALDSLKESAGMAPGGRTPIADTAGRWVAYAAAHPNLYRLVSGEGWHLPGLGRQGIHGLITVASPRRALETAIRTRTRRLGRREGDPELTCYLAPAIHGLALARIDGLGSASVEKALACALRATMLPPPTAPKRPPRPRPSRGKPAA